MKQKEIQIDEEKCVDIAREIGKYIEGLTLPHVFCVIGTLVLEIIHNAKVQGVDVKSVVCDWLHALVLHIIDLPDEEEEEEQEAVN